MAGLTSTGFLPRTLQEIKTLLEAAFQAVYGLGIDLRAQSEAGQVIGTFSDKLAEEWEVGEDIWASSDPDQATGVALDRLCAFTGTIRRGAIASTVDLWLTGDADTTITAGSQIAVLNSEGAALDTVFETDETATLVEMPAVEASTAYSVGEVVSCPGTITGNAFCLLCIGDGRVEAVVPDESIVLELLLTFPFPTEVEATFIIGGSTAEWRFLGWGSSAALVPCTCTETGPLTGPMRTIQHISTPINGWKSAVNIEEATLGSEIETDPLLRARRIAEIYRSGASTVGAMRSDLLDVDDVTDALVFENSTDVTDAMSIPPHSILVITLGGSDDDIGQVILDNKAAGIGTTGTETVVVEDTEGVDHTYHFSRVEEKDIYVTISVSVNPDTYPVGGDDLVAAAISNFGNTFPIGKDVKLSAIQSQAFSVPGVLDVVTIYMKVGSAPTTETSPIPISLTQIARFSVTNISVTSTDGSPQ